MAEIVKTENNLSTLQIYNKYLDLVYYTNDIVRKYPKSEKFALVNEIKNSVYGGLKTIMFAQKEFTKQARLKHLNYLDVYLNLLKVHVRLSYRYRYISMQNYETWSAKITDICNMLGAWIKVCLTK